MNGVWHCLNTDSGGVARFVEHLVLAQARSNVPPAHKMRVTAPPGLALPSGVRHYVYKPQRRVWGLNQWRFAALAPRSSRSPDCLVHAHSYVLAVPDVYTVHNLYSVYRRPWFEQYRQVRSVEVLSHMFQYVMLCRLERRMLATARRVVFVSTQNRCHVEDKLGIRRPDHFQVILPGVDTERHHPGLRDQREHWRRRHFPGIDPMGRWLVFVGLDFAGKGLLRLLEALVSQPRREDWRLLVFGEDPANQRAVEAIVSKDPGRQVHLLGKDPRLTQAFQLSDCLVMDSISEGFPLVLLEAMASGTVPVVTDFGGVSDLIMDGSNGMVCENAAAVVEAALSLPSDYLMALSDSGTRIAGKRTWTRVAAEYAECYAAAGAALEMSARFPMDRLPQAAKDD